MQVSVEQTGSIERKLTISIPAQEIDQEIAVRLQKIARRAKIDGFRPGKVPPNIIKQRYSVQVTNEVITDTINRSYPEALQQEKLTPAGLVSLQPQQFNPGQDLQYHAVVDLYPDITTVSLAAQSIEKPSCEVTAKDVDDTLQDIRQRNPDYINKTAPAAAGDQVTIDYDCKADGQPAQQAQEIPLVLGQGQLPEEFENGLLGVTAGDHKQISLTYPTDYHATDLAGKTAQCDVTVKQVAEARLPELNAELLQKLGIAEGGVPRLRTEIETNLNYELTERMHLVLRDKVMQALCEANDLTLPRAMVASEIDYAMQVAHEQAKAQGRPAPPTVREHYQAAAEKRVTLSLIAKEVMQQQSLKVDSAELRARVDQMALSYDDAEQFVQYCYAKPERLREIEARLLEEKIIDYLLSTAEVKEVKQPFKEFMQAPLPL